MDKSTPSTPEVSKAEERTDSLVQDLHLPPLIPAAFERLRRESGNFKLDRSPEMESRLLTSSSKFFRNMIGFEQVAKSRNPESEIPTANFQTNWNPAG